MIKDIRKNNLTLLGVFLTQILILTIGVISIKIATVNLSQENFGLYNIIKRGIPVISFPLLMSLGISIPKFMSINFENNREKAYNYWFSAIVLLIIMSVVGMIIIKLEGNRIFSILHIPVGDNGQNKILIFVSILGLCFYTLIYAYYKAISNFRIANVTNLLCIGFFPLFTLIYFNDVVKIFYYNGLFVLTICGGLTLYTCFRHKTSTFRKYLLTNIKELFYFGFPRILGEAALFGLFTVPLILSANVYNLKYTASFGLALSLFQLIVGMLEFVNIVMFPEIGKLVGDGKWQEINIKINLMAKFSLLYISFCIIGIWVAAEPLLSFLFGEVYQNAARILKILSMALLPYISYNTLRNPVDLISNFPYNTINLVIGILIIFLGGIFFNRYISIDIWLVLGLFYIGISNYISFKLLIINKI